MADGATQDTSKATAATTENDKAEGEEIVQKEVYGSCVIFCFFFPPFLGENTTTFTTLVSTL